MTCGLDEVGMGGGQPVDLGPQAARAVPALPDHRARPAGTGPGRGRPPTGPGRRATGWAGAGGGEAGQFRRARGRPRWCRRAGVATTSKPASSRRSTAAGGAVIR